ncbi:mitochondrial thiamine pyrophosphate carrier 1 [Trichomonascus vanleenenianus]|uniref:mitochondrial thiamine pyrophosphate carrier 1 n=1 Tax=Trichomonascus vanleenenianus TaxID=2268995 RepID=UPI003ECA5824
MCGGLAGLVSRFVIAPLDVLKIRLQLQVTKPQYNPGTAIINTACSILKNEGVTALWKGNIPAEILYVLYGATQFTAYKAINNLCNSYNMPDTLNLFVSGSSAGVLATSATYPFDLLRTRFAAQVSRTDRLYTGLIQSIRHVYQHEGGLRGFWRGAAPAVLSIVPYMGVFFVVYEKGRVLLASQATLDLLPAPEATSGFVAGVIAKTVVFPLDVIRKRLQVQGPARSSFAGGHIPLYPTNVVSCARQIVLTEGVRGLYKGFFISLVKNAPASAVTIWTFERSLTTYRWLRGREDVLD